MSVEDNVIEFQAVQGYMNKLTVEEQLERLSKYAHVLLASNMPRKDWQLLVWYIDIIRSSHLAEKVGAK
jgi:hypothetical protein